LLLGKVIELQTLSPSRGGFKVRRTPVVVNIMLVRIYIYFDTQHSYTFLIFKHLI